MEKKKVKISWGRPQAVLIFVGTFIFIGAMAASRWARVINTVLILIIFAYLLLGV